MHLLAYRGYPGSVTLLLLAALSWSAEVLSGPVLVDDVSGWGGASMLAYTRPPDGVVVSGDCDDAWPDAHPGGTERWDGHDDGDGAVVDGSAARSVVD